MKYDELQDTGLKINSVSTKLKLVASRLKAIETIDTELYVNALQSSALLCLADMRAQSPYHSFSKRLTIQEFTNFNKQLKPLGLSIYSDDFLPIKLDQQKQTDFAFINHWALSHIDKRYRKLVNINYPVALAPDNTQSLVTGWHVQELSLADNMEKDTLPNYWLHDWFNPMNLRFGMELGYPGSAIASFLYDTSELRDDMEEMRVDIKQEYDGTWITFGYKKGIEGNHDIQTTVNTWQHLISETRKLFPTNIVMSKPAIASALKDLSQG